VRVSFSAGVRDVLRLATPSTPGDHLFVIPIFGERE